MSTQSGAGVAECRYVQACGCVPIYPGKQFTVIFFIQTNKKGEGIMKGKANGLVVAGLLVLCMTGFAGGADIAASAKFGTPGFGLEVTMPYNEQFNWRAGLGFFTLGMDKTEEPDEGEDGGATDISADVDLFTLGAYADWHPWENRFRVTAGLVINNNEISLSADPGDTIDFNDREYRVESVNGGVSFNSLCPYIGIGVGNPFKGEGRWFFTFDAGIMFHGAPKVSLSARASNPAEQAALDADVKKEKKDMEDDVSSFVIWPVLSAGVTYRF